MEVSFSAPANNGGSAITGFTVTSSPAGGTATGASSPLTVTGLTASTSYTFTVTATNAIGTSPASAASSAVSTSAPELYSFTSVRFNGQSSGRTAPSLSTIKSAMTGTSAAGSWKDNTSYLNSSSGKILWTVPKNGTYTFTIAGAMGGANKYTYDGGGFALGGYGAVGTTSATLTEGTVMEMLAGHGGRSDTEMDGTGGQCAGGGGGASYVRIQSSTVLGCAGGGGGGSRNQPSIGFSSWDGSSATTAAPHVTTSSTVGGVGGYDSDIGGTHEGGGGAGFAQNGVRAANSPTFNSIRLGTAIGSGNAEGGISGTNSSGTGGDGGFGGGGGGGVGNGAGGGGGGYRGGWGGVYQAPGIGNGSTRTNGQSGSGGDSFNISFTAWNSDRPGWINITVA
jgi:hypothetical protein